MNVERYTLARSDAPSKEGARNMHNTHNYSNQMKLAAEKHNMKALDKLKLHPEAGYNDRFNGLLSEGHQNLATSQ
jgi:hypothetical protein